MEGARVRIESKPKKNSYLRTTPSICCQHGVGRKTLSFLSYHSVHEQRRTSTFSLESPAKLLEYSYIMCSWACCDYGAGVFGLFKPCCNLLLPQKREGFCCGFMRLKKKFVLFCNGIRPGRIVTCISKHSLIIITLNIGPFPQPVLGERERLLQFLFFERP